MPEKSASIWLRPERSGRGPDPTHGRDQIAAAAMKLADAGGLESVSTRKVAAAIGAGATSLYRYVENRDELLELMLDAASGEIDLTRKATGDWRVDLLGLARQLKSLYERHPWMLDLNQGQASLTPHSVDLLEYALSLMTEIRMSGTLKMEAIGLLNGAVAMVSRLELASGRTTAAWQAAQVEYLTAVVTAGRHPHLAAVIAESAPNSGAKSDNSDETPSGGTGSGGTGSEDLLERILLRLLAGVLE